MSTNHAERQRRYEDTYFEREERERPRPRLEMASINALALRCKDGDASAYLLWALVTPQDFLIAQAAMRWDEQHPFYSCIACHDGKDLPKGYVCQVCGADNPRGY